MLIATANNLVEVIRDLELLDPDRLAQLVVTARRFASPRQLASLLVSQEWLTAFQVNHLLQGRGRALRLGPYVLVERIASGGMGEVFKAQHCWLRRMAAVKVVSRERLARANALPRFLREAESAAKLSHPNIVAVYDFGVVEETHYLAMEFIDGIDLARLVAKSGPLPVALACDFVRQAALGLHHAHEQGFVHRDIKPQNLLVATRTPCHSGPSENIEGYVGGTVKILDLGLIRPQVEQNRGALTQTGVVIGTLDYLAPEQALDPHHVDRRADLYSLGCTLYHLLAGRVPFPGGLPMDKLLHHQADYPTSICELRSDVPVELDEILLSMLAKDPSMRMPTAADAAIALTPFARQGVTTPAMVVAPPPAVEQSVFADLESSENSTTVMEAGKSVTKPIITRSRILRSTRAIPPTSTRWWPACARVLRLPVNAIRVLLNASTLWGGRGADETRNS
jgi:serine/threonine-protein kinase